MINLDNQKLLRIYELMVLARRYEERLAELFAAGQIPGWLHSCLGQEAAGMALSVLLGPKDYLRGSGISRPLDEFSGPGDVWKEARVLPG